MVGSLRALDIEIASDGNFPPFEVGYDCDGCAPQGVVRFYLSDEQKFAMSERQFMTVAKVLSNVMDLQTPRQGGRFDFEI
ncbi:hypothetical protein N5W20_05490 [Candidatus Kirkpatrickella diaphorinae]|uniref:Uncharacterized protein n=1 Tax=Candidatus Kirkpatrickella diaphorinae TaxID=2984322 RepID=A0ABY6GGG6_9PROT|nr:hypothetical protein [Candidatus Kirkpatrickella diaphorinae]UYH50582.1 hypothetical protein N5W20_05490 [Candidatus Kirkpatrickella diaphorinae]